MHSPVALRTGTAPEPLFQGWRTTPSARVYSCHSTAGSRTWCCCQRTEPPRSGGAGGREGDGETRSMRRRMEVETEWEAGVWHKPSRWRVEIHLAGQFCEFWFALNNDHCCLCEAVKLEFEMTLHKGNKHLFDSHLVSCPDMTTNSLTITMITSI